MSSFLKFIAFLVVIVASSANSLNSYKDQNVIDRFRNWVDDFRIKSNDDHHLAHMFENWLGNDKFIEFTNSKNLTYTLGHNSYSGMNSEEFSEFMGFKANNDLLAPIALLTC